MTFELQSGEIETPIVKKFKETGDNDNRGKRLRTAKNSTCRTESSAKELMEPEKGPTPAARTLFTKTSADGSRNVFYDLRWSQRRHAIVPSTRHKTR
jgi:hypothetical protein